MWKKLLISLLAVGAAAAPYGTTDFMDLVADDDDTFYCIIGGDCSHWVDVIREQLQLTTEELITVAADVSVFKANEPDANLRWDIASPTASKLRADAPATEPLPAHSLVLGALVWDNALEYEVTVGAGGGPSLQTV